MRISLSEIYLLWPTDVILLITINEASNKISKIVFYYK